MRIFTALLTMFILVSTDGASGSTKLESNFFANESVQRRQPEAFVLQPEAEDFIRNLDDETINERSNLVKAIAKLPDLYEAIKNWETLSFEEQVPFLQQIFSIQIKLLNITPPALVIDSAEIPGRAAYFDFNLENPTPGRVILNPDVLKGMDKYASLALLVHETRHSAQFQLAFGFGANSASISAKAYRAAFQAQKTEIKSFCDFLTLANEFEAFQFGNYVLGKLTGWKVDLPGMGTFASQYDRQGKLKINLIHMLDGGTSRSLLESFNEAEIDQCKLIGAC